MIDKKSALVGLIVFSKDGQKLLPNMIRKVAAIAEIKEPSNVYLVNGKLNNINSVHDIRTERSFLGLSIVLRVMTEDNATVLISKLDNLQKESGSEVHKRSLSLNLLVFEDHTCMTPKLTLPHPELHNRPEHLIPAAEIWGDYVHPVLNESLTSLSKKYIGRSWGEFFAQGKSVLDF